MEPYFLFPNTQITKFFILSRLYRVSWLSGTQFYTAQTRDASKNALSSLNLLFFV